MSWKTSRRKSNRRVDVPVPHASEEDNVWSCEVSPRAHHQESTEKIVGVPVPHIKKEIVLHIMKEFLTESVPHVTIQVRTEIMDILQ